MVNVAAVLCSASASAHDLAVGVDGGYAFRSAPDGRNHGAAAALFVDVPLVGALGLRPEIVALGFGASALAPTPLGLVAGALSLTYAFDDTQVLAAASLGPLVGASVGGSGFAPDTIVHLGALAAVGLRVPLASAVSFDVRASVPLVLVGRGGLVAPGQTSYADGTAVELPLQTAFLLGVTLDLEGLWAFAGEP